MRIILAFLISIFFSLSSMAQVTGKVTDTSTKEELAYATVSVTDSISGKVIAFAYTDENGKFELEIPKNIKNGILSVQYLGYATYTTSITSQISAKLNIVLQALANELSEVTVTAKKKAVTVKGDKVIFNIEQSGIGNGNNGLETMQQIPGISLDRNENLQFRGSTEVQIMINGKKSLLQGEALREFIRSLQGDDIQSVEIIAQPSARYEAAGTTGILNIVLKKSRKESFSGNVYARAGYGEYFKHRYGGKVYYNDSLWNLNANGYYYKGNSVNHRRIIQTIQLTDGERVIDQSNEWLPHTVTKSFNLGIERTLGKHQLISTEWQYNNTFQKANTYGNTDEYNNGILTDNVKLLKKVRGTNKQVSGNVYYNYTSDSATTKLETQLNYAHYKQETDGFQRNNYTDGSYMQLDGRGSTQYNIITGQLDFNQQLSKKLHLEVGAKYSYVDMNYFKTNETNNASLLFIPDSLLTNDFDYKEKLTSAYTQLSFNLEKWNFLVGLRLENTDYHALSKISGQVNSGNYTNWFPSFSVNYTKGNNQYKLSYSRRIGRPNYLQLNPYYNYLDAYTLERGNSYLKPQLYHSFELGYVYKSALNVNLYGYVYNNGFTSVIDYNEDDNYSIYYDANTSTGSRFGLSVSLPYKPTDWWNMQLELDANRRSQKSDIPNYTYDVTGWGYSASLYQRFTLPKDLTITWNSFYYKTEYTNGYNRPSYDFSLSVKKMFWNKKVQLQGGCTNILKKNMYSNVSQVENVTTDWTNKWETRKFYLQITYYFGGKKGKEVKGTSLGDEKNRM